LPLTGTSTKKAYYFTFDNIRDDSSHGGRSYTFSPFKTPRKTPGRKAIKIETELIPTIEKKAESLMNHLKEVNNLADQLNQLNDFYHIETITNNTLKTKMIKDTLKKSYEFFEPPANSRSSLAKLHIPLYGYTTKHKDTEPKKTLLKPRNTLRYKRAGNIRTLQV